MCLRTLFQLRWISIQLYQYTYKAIKIFRKIVPKAFVFTSLISGKYKINYASSNNFLFIGKRAKVRKNRFRAEVIKLFHNKKIYITTKSSLLTKSMLYAGRMRAKHMKFYNN